MSRILTDEQKEFVEKAKARVGIYRNDKGELTLRCKDCTVMYLAMLLQIIDDLEFELEQSNK